MQLYSTQVILLKNPSKNLKILGYPPPPPYKSCFYEGSLGLDSDFYYLAGCSTRIPVVNYQTLQLQSEPSRITNLNGKNYTRY